MTEQEASRLIRGLQKHSEEWRSSTTANRKPAEQRNPERERELMECFRNR